MLQAKNESGSDKLIIMNVTVIISWFVGFTIFSVFETVELLDLMNMSWTCNFVRANYAIALNFRINPVIDFVKYRAVAKWFLSRKDAFFA